MTTSLKIAIESLYKTFSKYPLNPTIEGCPCCVSEQDNSKLFSKSLRKLEEEEISHYTFKAMTTWGEVDDFKHYLPRIFELSARRELWVDTFVILGKLEYGNWLYWDKVEKNTIINFLNAWWKYDINHHVSFDIELFIETYKATKNLPLLLANWKLNIETPGFKNYLAFIEKYYHDLSREIKPFKIFNKEEIEAFKNWTKSNSNKLEEGFFLYEKEDQAFSTRISNTLYLLERID